MRTPSLIATMLTLALTAAPAVTAATAAPVPDPIAHAAGQQADPGSHYVDPFGHHHAPKPGDPYVDPLGATTGAPAPGHAYGKACADESHKHVQGQQGTPFSQCVHALQALSNGSKHTAVGACRTESHRHVKGQKGTPFSRCVAAARTLTHKRTHAHRVAGPR